MAITLSETQARDAFATVDIDGDGQISPDELRHLWDRTDGTLTDEDLAGIFESADTDKDGLISFEEFFKLVS
jgi:Ca2+-binding EF-hand superfamily protein